MDVPFLKKSKMKCLWSVKSWLYYEKLLSNSIHPVKNLKEAVQQQCDLIAISWQVDEQVKAHFWWVAKVVIRFEHEFFIVINSKGTMYLNESKERWQDGNYVILKLPIKTIKLLVLKELCLLYKLFHFFWYMWFEYTFYSVFPWIWLEILSSLLLNQQAITFKADLPKSLYISSAVRHL